VIEEELRASRRGRAKRYEDPFVLKLLASSLGGHKNRIRFETRAWRAPTQGNNCLPFFLGIAP
jgi:hypothetical protein